MVYGLVYDQNPGHVPPRPLGDTAKTQLTPGMAIKTNTQTGMWRRCANQ